MITKVQHDFGTNNPRSEIGKKVRYRQRICRIKMMVLRNDQKGAKLVIF